MRISALLSRRSIKKVFCQRGGGMSKVRNFSMENVLEILTPSCQTTIISTLHTLRTPRQFSSHFQSVRLDKIFVRVQAPGTPRYMP